ncbi:MAG: hypothetical protein HY447_04460 [Candidatus Omnitrophica bacterium]|nr:hypothetical protein [Candidatus Omnitrophota bacterium]
MKDLHVRIEGPREGPVTLPQDKPGEKKLSEKKPGLPFFYGLLLFLSVVLSGVSLYFTYLFFTA